MSPISNFGLLALAGVAAAVPHAHAHGHQHLHARDSQSHVSMPSCWSTCFAKYNVGSESSLCNSATGSSVKSCIDTSCKNTPGAVRQYNAWASSYCSASAGGTGTGTGTAASGTAPATAWPTQTYPAQSSPINTATGSWTTSVCTETSTLIYRTSTQYTTYLVTHTLTAPESAVATASATWTAGETCAADVTVTTKVYATVTVTAGAWGGETNAAVPSSSAGWGGEGQWTSTGGWGETTSTTTTTAVSSPVSPVWTSPEASTPTSPVWTSPEASTPTSPVWTSSEVSTPAAYTPASSTETVTSTPVSPVAVSSSTSVAWTSTSSSAWTPSSSSASASATSTSTPNGSAPFSKRGLAYNDAGDCAPFYGNSEIGWAYNWGSLPEGLDSSLAYIPMLWSNAEPFVGYWDVNAATCLSSGAEYFFSFNEPDMTSQANMSPQEAADAWMQYMEPYAGKVKLVAPAVTNGVGAGLGLDWLTQFLAACSECTIDAVNQHWYDSTGNDVAMFQQQVSDIISTSGKPVFVTEFAGIGSDDEIISFMDQVVGWMDSNESVVGYSYYMVGDGFLNDGSGLSPLGTAYNSAN